MMDITCCGESTISSFRSPMNTPPCREKEREREYGNELRRLDVMVRRW
jgi:hypothetical protein